MSSRAMSRRSAAHISAPLILENITATVLIPGAEMDEPEFVGAVLGEAGCGWLCDVTNLFTNAFNEGRERRPNSSAGRGSASCRCISPAGA